MFCLSKWTHALSIRTKIGLLGERHRRYAPATQCANALWGLRGSTWEHDAKSWQGGSVIYRGQAADRKRTCIGWSKIHHRIPYFRLYIRLYTYNRTCALVRANRVRILKKISCAKCYHLLSYMHQFTHLGMCLQGAHIASNATRRLWVFADGR